MTTIVYSPRHREMAADTLCSDDEYYSKSYMQKIFKTKGGRLYGASKEIFPGEVFHAYMRGDLTREEALESFSTLSSKEEPFEALVVEPDGFMYLYNRMLQPVRLNPFRPYAIGSGGKCAMAALFVGATPYEAVQAACEYDLYSGGGIDVLKL